MKHGVAYKWLKDMRELFDAVMWEWQSDAYRAWIGAKRVGVVHMATGAGKTLIGIRAALEHVFGPWFEPKGVLILVPTTVLAKQWFEKFREIGAGHLVRLVGGEPGMEPISSFVANPFTPEKPIAIMTYAGFLQVVDRAGLEELASNYGLVIVDEAHHLREEGRLNETIAKLVELGTKYLGLTATPRPEESLGGVPMVVVDYGLEKMVSMGIIPGAYVYVFTIADRSQYVDATVEAVKELLEKGASKIFVFVRTIGFGEELLEKLMKEGIRVGFAHGGFKKPFEWLKEGRINVLITTPVGAEGLDIAEADGAVITEGISDKVAVIQRIGRVLRPVYARKRYIALVMPLNKLEKLKEVVHLLGRFAETVHEHRPIQNREALGKLREMLSDVDTTYNVLKVVSDVVSRVEEMQDKVFGELDEEDRRYLRAWYLLFEALYGKDPVKSLKLDLARTARSVTKVKSWVTRHKLIDLPSVDTRLEKVEREEAVRKTEQLLRI